MSIEIIHVSDIHFGSGEGHGKINPQTGLNTRFEDFIASFTKVVDFAIDNQTDCVIFAGDAYKTANPEPIYQKYFAREIKRLSQNNIITILLVGNHDQIHKSTESHSLSVFDSLKVENVYIIDSPCLQTFKCKNGKFQLIGLPHITKHLLSTQSQLQSLGNANLDETIINQVETILQDYYNKLDSTLPSIITAHMTVDKALAGIEEELLLGYSLTFPVSLFMNDKIDYVALGHVHKHQIINRANPAIVYCGSIDRVDFGEESEDKGFVQVSLNRAGTSYKFHSLNPRPFITIETDLRNVDNPNLFLAKKINNYNINDCVLRIKYTIDSDNLYKLNETEIKKICTPAMSYKLIPDIKPSFSRIRIPNLQEAILESPKQALSTYLKESLNLNEAELNKFINLINELNIDNN